LREDKVNKVIKVDKVRLALAGKFNSAGVEGLLWVTKSQASGLGWRPINWLQGLKPLVHIACKAIID